jgi:nicotinamide mononucleotide adenylyltransferase
MTTTALFLGRFQPPHVGHLLTIRSLGDRYEKIIVGATESQPSVMPVPDVLEILRRLLPDSKFDFIPVRGSVEDGTAVINCEFDVCCSGNFAVLARMAEKGYATEFVARSSDAIYSGTQERNAYVEKAIATAESRQDGPLTAFEIMDIAALRPIEKINPTHFRGIERDILSSGIMNRPLIADRKSLAVLDGSHRYAFLVKHGYQRAPVILCDYDDESIFVGNHLGHRFAHDEKKWISKQHVRATAISGKLYEPRTTRHFFPFRKTDHPTMLSTLTPSGERSIEHLIATILPAQEIAMNNEYIDELRAESSILQQYMDEQRDVLAWLNGQNRYIAGTAKK